MLTRDWVKGYRLQVCNGGWSINRAWRIKLSMVRESMRSGGEGKWKNQS